MVWRIESLTRQVDLQKKIVEALTPFNTGQTELVVIQQKAAVKGLELESELKYRQDQLAKCS